MLAAKTKQLNETLDTIHRQLLDKDEVILTIAKSYDKSQPELQLQRGIEMGFYQCQASFYLHDALEHGLKAKLAALITVPNISMALSTDTILDKIKLYTNGYPNQYFSNNRDNVCPAWEYGIYLTESKSDKAIQDHYAATKNSDIANSDTFVKMSTPSLALFCVLNHYDETLNPEALNNAAKLIRDHQLIVPKKYHEVLLKSPYFTISEIEILKKQYDKGYSHQKEMRMDIAQANRLRGDVLPELRKRTKLHPSTDEEKLAVLVKTIKIIRITPPKSN